MAAMKADSSGKVNNIFFLHPTKCGGNAAASALRETKLKILKTNFIRPNAEFLEILQTSCDLVVHGHIEDIQRPCSPEEFRFFRKIILVLYYEYNLIMPTRNPANLIQSWMHYCKTRSNNALNRVAKDSEALVSAKESSFMKRLSKLKQNSLIYNPSADVFVRGVDFPRISLLEEDEAENLIRFMNDLRESETSLPMLLPMQRQLFFPLWKSLAQKYVSGEPYKLKLPVSTGLDSFIIIPAKG